MIPRVALGVSVERSRLLMMLVAVVLTAAATAWRAIPYCLVAPHIARRISGTARWGLDPGGAVRGTFTAGGRSLRPTTVYAVSTSGWRRYRQPRRYLPYRLVNSGVPQKMIESVARLRGDQLTLGYGKFTVAENLNVSIPERPFHRDYRAKRLREINATAHAESSDDARAR